MTAASTRRRGRAFRTRSSNSVSKGVIWNRRPRTDYEANINSLLGGQCDVIFTIGFLLGDATQSSAQANPDQKYSIVDFAYDPVISNVIGQVYATDQAAFLAGYLAAGMSKRVFWEPLAASTFRR